MLSAIELTMKLVGGKWKCLILYHLGGGARRTRDLLERLGGISPKVLTEQLRQLEADGLVAREVFAEVPARGIPPERGGQNLSARALYAVRLGQGIRPAPRNGNQPLPAACRVRQLKLRQPETKAA